MRSSTLAFRSLGFCGVIAASFLSGLVLAFQLLPRSDTFSTLELVGVLGLIVCPIGAGFAGALWPERVARMLSGPSGPPVVGVPGEDVIPALVRRHEPAPRPRPVGTHRRTDQDRGMGAEPVRVTAAMLPRGAMSGRA